MSKIQAPRGAPDYFPPRSDLFEHVIRTGKEVFRSYGYRPIFTPGFEHTEVFERGLEQGSDIVGKEMYTFEDRSGRSLTLRPEGTAPVVRAILQHTLHRKGVPVKVYYSCEVYRHERPQKGRYRALRQMGVEAVGVDSPALDAEVIETGVRVYSRLGLGIRLRVNSIGHPECRSEYMPKLVAFLEAHRDELCADCRRKISTNPLRTFDCKVDHEVMSRAPAITEHLCERCEADFESVKRFLTEAGISFEVDSRLVRGLDYYTKTTFVFVAAGLGSQDEVGGGGRYDGLAEALGGEPLAGIGFGLGIDRMVLALEAAGVSHEEALDAFVIGDETGGANARDLARHLRAGGLRVEIDHSGRRLRRQLTAADRAGARFAVILREREMASGEPTVRNMSTGEESPVRREVLIDYLRSEP